MYSVSSHVSCADTYPIQAQYVRYMHNTSSIRVLPSDAVDTARYTVDTQPIRSRYAGCTLSLALCPKLKEPVLLLVTRVWGRLRLTCKGRGRLGRLGRRRPCRRLGRMQRRGRGRRRSRRVVVRGPGSPSPRLRCLPRAPRRRRGALRRRGNRRVLVLYHVY